MRVLYMAINLVNNKKYIGQTKNYEKRIYAHCKAKANPSLIFHAIQKYGINNFKFQKLAVFEDWMIDEAEVKAIQEYNTLVPNGYNLDHGGCKCKVMSEESKKKMSDYRKGKSPANKGKKLSPEQKEKISIAVKKAINKITYKEDGTPIKYIPWNKGKKLSEDEKLKRKGIKRGPYSNKGRKLSEEHKKKLSLAKTGKPSNKKGKRVSEESRKKMSISAKEKCRTQKQREELINRINHMKNKKKVIANEN